MRKRKGVRGKECVCMFIKGGRIKEERKRQRRREKKRERKRERERER